VYRPTLGGIKKLQDFLAIHGHPMPHFQMNTYDDPVFNERRGEPIVYGGRRIILPIDQAIQELGVMCEVLDVRVISEDRSCYLDFVNSEHLSPFVALEAYMNNSDCAERYVCNGVECAKFYETNRMNIWNLARYGKAKPSFVDRWRFSHRPERYRQLVFAH